jgi:hypothetical protein
MLFDGFPQHGIARWEVFAPQQDTTTSRGWQAWLKPIGAQWIYMFAVGGGGGGGGGQSTAAAARTGGGGGASASFCRLLVPAFVFSDAIYIRAGSGGAGGAAAGNGTAGTTTYVSTSQDTSAYPILTAFGGNAGQAAATGGTAPGSAQVGAFATWAISARDAGLVGSNGGANTGAAGSSVGSNSGWIMLPGAGGASSSTGNSVAAGGAQTIVSPTMGPALWATIAGGIAGVSGSQAGGAGNPGYNHGIHLDHMMSRSQPLIFGGGSGGGSGGASLGGKGGDGAWGSGGGGGGAGSTGGAGGKGGDGFVIIGAF